MRRHRRRTQVARARRRDQRGAVAVEFALVLPLLVMLLLGVTTAGIALSNSLGLTNAVREGSRFAAIAPFTTATASAWANDVRARTRATQFDDPASASKICVDIYKQGAGNLMPAVNRCSTSSIISETPATFAPPPNTPAGKCVVQVWAARTFTISGVLFNYEKVMTRRSVAVYEVATCG